MRDGARYVKIVEWSMEDDCYVGSAAGVALAASNKRVPLVSLLPVRTSVDMALGPLPRDGRTIPPSIWQSISTQFCT